MNYYEHHLGDYAAATAHLSWDEDMAYTRLIRAYYHHEKPIPLEMRDACRLARAQSAAQRKAVETVLQEFFIRCDDGWHQKRCDQEIEHFKDKQSKAKRSADARWNAKRSDSEGNANASETHTERIPNAVPRQCEGNAPNPNPNPNLQKKIKTKSANALAEARAVAGLNLDEFERWIGYRAERKPAIKPPSLKAAAEELAAFGDQQSAVVKHSIANGYQGLFAPKVNGAHAVMTHTPRQKTEAELEREAIENGITAGKTDAEIHAQINSQFVSLEDIRAKREEMQHVQH